MHSSTNCPLRAALAVSHRLWYVSTSTFIMFQGISWFPFRVFSSILWMFRSILFNMHLFVYFPAFLLLLISSFIPLCLAKKNTCYDFSLLNCAKAYFVTCHMIYLEESSVCIWIQCVFCWINVLHMSVRFICSNIWFESNVSLLISCLDELSMVDTGAFKSPTIIVLLSLIPF